MPEKPLHPAFGIFRLLKSHYQVGVRLEVRGILIGSRIPRLLCRELIPLFARQLATAAAGTFRCIKEFNFLCHLSHPLFTTLTMNALLSGIMVLASPIVGVSRLAASP
jgi:hypothetical protein